MERRPFDYSWIVFGIIILIIIVGYKPVMNKISAAREKSDSTSEWAKGKVIFYDPAAWGRENRSCAMCHAKDYTLAEGFDKVGMGDFGYVELKDLKKTYGVGVLGSPERLLKQVNNCLMSGARIEGGTIDTANLKTEPLIAYLLREFG